VISASAGSGKTHRLCEEVCRAIQEGRARPEGVVAVTFTNRAAAELRQRVRRRLLEEGMAEEAHRLGAARMGTVHSVCEGLVGEFAFALGLFPELEVLDQEQAGRHLRQALDRALDLERQAALARLSERFGRGSPEELLEEVRTVVEQARVNGLGPQDLSRSCQYSLEQCLALLSSPPLSPQEARSLERRLQRALERFLAGVDRRNDETRTTEGAVEVAGRILGRLRQGRMRWPDWARLSKLRAARASDHLLEPVRKLAAAHHRHPEFRGDLEQAIRLVFTLAQAALSDYQEYKRQRGAVDFADQERLALELLGRDEVCRTLSQELDLLLVDEFQDTSPIQLAIFLRLAEVCGEAVWVGDQKQAIYGFRGTDPALMDACLEALGREGVESLPLSWRSRPRLVELTSAVFARAFAGHGIEERLVRLKPAQAREPRGLGPVVERWVLEGGNKAQRLQALAAGVAELLQEQGVRVRDQDTGRARSIHPRDLAVLCRTNQTCEELAAALEEAGVPVQIPGPGLMSTLEVLVVQAGLALWVDGRDTLAAAELARLLHYPRRPQKWLEGLLREEGAKELLELKEVRAVRESARRHPAAGPVTALELVMEATGVAARALAWGRAEERLANLEALHAHACAYQEQARGEGAAATPAGLLAYLQDLAACDEDTRGLAPEQDAVVVSTWHSAKGLEWPVTVLYDLDWSRPPSLTGVVVRGREDGFDLEQPLAGRWVRYWPQPYGQHEKDLPFLEAIRDSADYQYRCQEDEHQLLRLLYVGWTRARDRLVLAAPPGVLEKDKGPVGLLRDQGRPILCEPEATEGVERLCWAGVEFTCRVRSPDPAAPVPASRQPGQGYRHPGPQPHPPALVSPSALGGEGRVVETSELGPRIALHEAQGRMEAVGEAVHTFLAVELEGLSARRRRELAWEVLQRWSVADLIPPADLVRAAEALESWLERRWPGARRRREWPVCCRLPQGGLLAGRADLVVMAEHGFVVVDHKAFPGQGAQAREHARGFAGQLAAYADAIARATGLSCLGTYIHLPLAGLVCEVAPCS
jgi:ATP-dependent exoDNAse (exonuclease V) beta subunit